MALDHIEAPVALRNTVRSDCVPRRRIIRHRRRCLGLERMQFQAEGLSSFLSFSLFLWQDIIAWARTAGSVHSCHHPRSLINNVFLNAIARFTNREPVLRNAHVDVFLGIFIDRFTISTLRFPRPDMIDKGVNEVQNPGTKKGCRQGSELDAASSWWIPRGRF